MAKVGAETPLLLWDPWDAAGQHGEPSAPLGAGHHLQDLAAGPPGDDEAEGILVDLHPVERGGRPGAHPQRGQGHLVALPGRVAELRAGTGAQPGPGAAGAAGRGPGAP